ncbi:MAG: dockerin type I domain-containing protein [Haloarculaceae archaeon]
MNPSRNVLYVTRDYGRTWQRLGNYSAANALTHAVANDGTVHVAYSKNDDTYLDTYDPSGTKTSNQTLSGPLNELPKHGENCRSCPQVLTVEADDSSHVVLFTYMTGPFESTDSGGQWTQLYLANKVIVNGPGVNPEKLRTGTITKPDRGPKRTMARPVDYRSAVMMEEAGKGDQVLVGSDQGLFMMRVEDRTVGKRIQLLNLAGTMDHSQVYDVNVDDCGNLYHGLWHHSGMIRTPGGSKNVEQRWRTRQQYQRRGLYRQPLYLGYQPYYTGGEEAGNVFVKDRSDCLSWASLGDAMTDPQLYFSPYVTNDSGPLRKEKIAGLDDDNYENATGGPKFFDGRWHYKNKYTNELRSINLSTENQDLETPVKIDTTRQDESPPGNVDETLWYRYKNNEILVRFEGASRSSAETIAINFAVNDPPYRISHFDVTEGRVAVNIEHEKTGAEDIYIYNTTSTSEPITGSDISSLDNPFGGARIKEVFVDPTNDSRYFATVVDTSDLKCDEHLMVTEDGGNTWRKFSRELDCQRVWDLAFNEKNGRIYAATGGRGVFRGNLTSLNNPGANRRANLNVTLECGDREVTEIDTINCTVSLASSGDVSEWVNRQGGPDLEIDLPTRTIRYSLSTPVIRGTSGGSVLCSPKNATLGSADQFARIHCEDPLRNFPASGQVTFGMDIQKRLVSDDPASPEITARLNFSQGAPDFDTSDNSDTTTLDVHELPAQADRFDYHITDFGDVIRNDDRANATRILARDWNQTPDQFFACPENPDYPNGDAIVRRLQSQGKNCEGVLENGSQGAPLSGIQIYTANLSNLGIGFTEDFYNVTIIGEEVPPPTVGEVPPKEPTCGTFKQEFTRRRSNPTRTFLFTLPSSYRQYFAGEPSGQEDVQPRYQDKDVPPPVNRSFRQNGIDLGPKPSIQLPDGTTDWNAGRWIVHELTDYLVVEQPDGSLKVYRLNPAGTVKRFNRTIESHSRITINVTGTTITVADDDVPPDTQLIPLNATKVRPNVTTSSGATRNGDVTIERYPGLNRLSATVECPRDKDLGHLILALGQSLRTAGGYNLSLEYRVTYERGAARHATVSVGVGQYDEFGVDVNAGEWTDRPVDPERLEEIERAVAVGEIGLNPDPAPDGPPSRVRVSVSTLDGPTGGAPAFGRALETDGGHPYVRVEPLDRFEGRGRLTFTVRDETLERNGVGSDRVALFRYEGTERGWRRQQTERVGSTDTGERYRAEFDGLSLFAVGITAPDEAENVTLSLVPAERTVRSGTNATFEVVADGVDAGVGGYELVVNSTDTSRARIVGTTSGIGGESRRERAPDGSGATVAAFAGDTADDGPVTVATVTVAAGEPGTVELPLTVASVSDEAGEGYAVGRVTGSTVTVTEEPVAPDVTGDGNRATDPDGDGDYEDLNGDGEPTPGDATVLFNAVFEGDATVTDNPELFDFNGDREVNPGDATVLFDEVF